MGGAAWPGNRKITLRCPGFNGRGDPDLCRGARLADVELEVAGAVPFAVPPRIGGARQRADQCWPHEEDGPKRRGLGARQGAPQRRGPTGQLR
eukprot:3352516-Alexandrium_andersonii.AAC.1